MLSIDEATIRASHRYNHPIYVHGIGICSILFFGLCGIFGFVKILDKKPGLILNSEGIKFSAGITTVSSLPWSEVIGTSVYQVHNQKLLVVLLKQPEKYIEAGSKLKKILNRANYKMCGSPITLSSNSFKLRFHELEELLNRYVQKYGHV